MSPIDINAIKPILQQNDVAFAGIFGSRARDDYKESSDLDILVKFSKPKSLLDLVHIQNRLSDALHIKVDVVTENGLSPLIKDRVLNELVPIYGKG